MLILVALLTFFAIFDIMREMGEMGKGTYSLGAVMTFVGLSQAGHVGVIFPVAALLGTLFALSRLSNSSELTVMRASGLSLRTLSAYISVIGILFTVLTFVFGEYIAPAADDTAKQMRLTATSSLVGREFRSGFWVKDGLNFVNIQNVAPDLKLNNIRVYEFDKTFRLLSISIIKDAVYEKDKRWQISNVEKTYFEGQNAGGGARIERLPNAIWKSELTPDLLEALKLQPSQMSVAKLSAYVEHLRENKQETSRFELAMWEKLLRPFAVVIMMLLAIPFAIGMNRMGGTGAKLMAGIMVGLVFHVLSQMAANLAMLNNWPPFLSTATPLALFAIVAMVAIAWRERPF
jgi:lipopolysaccharide export system permease protein